MNILLLTDELFPGGVARHVVDLANGLKSKEISVSVAATDGTYRQSLHPDIPFVPLTLLEANSFRKNLSGIFPSYFKLCKLVNTTRFDIIHSHKRLSHFLGSLIPKRTAKHITSYHNVFPGKDILSVFGDYTVCCSNAVAAMVTTRYKKSPSRTSTVYNGMLPLKLHDDIRRRETYEELHIPVSKKIISSVGQFIPSKDRETLIRAVKILHDENKIANVVFVLLGFGYLQSQLEQLVRSLNLEQHVKFAESLFSIEALVNISEFMILNPKHSEGFGIVLLEGASVSKIHIGTSIGGIPEFIEQNQTGLLVSPENPSELAQAISFLLDNPAECVRMGQNAKMKFERYFQLEKMLSNMIEVYRKVLA